MSTKYSKFTYDCINTFVNGLSSYDLKARGVSTTDEYLKRYDNLNIPFTIQDTSVVSRAIKIADGWLEEYPILKKIPWCLILTDQSIEEGLPHTHGDTIFLSRSITISNNKPKNIAQTLVHEKVHILQRFKMELFDECYQRVLGFSLVGTTRSYRVHGSYLRRSNPDINEKIYAYKKKVIIQEEYDTDSPTRISGMSSPKFYVYQGDGLAISRKEVEDEYDIGEIGSVYQIEHPNEITASMIATMISNGKKIKPTLIEEHLDKFLRENK